MNTDYKTEKNSAKKVAVLSSLFFLSFSVLGFASETGLTNYYSKDPRASSPEITPEKAEDQLKIENQKATSKVLAPESPIQVIDSTSEINEAKTISFLDLHFDSTLEQKGEVKISDHETLLFKKDSVIAHSYGNEISLNLEDQKLLCISFSSYVLGPFTPAQDYMGVYFDTIESLKELIDKSVILEKKNANPDETYLEGLGQAKNTLIEFVKRAQKVQEEVTKQDLDTRLKGVIARYYEGDLPEHENLSFHEVKENKKSHWEAVMTIKPNPKAGAIQNRTFILSVIRDDFAVVKIEDRDSEGRVLLVETLDYDPTFVLKDHRIKMFYSNGKVKTDHDLRYEEGLKSTRYYREFDERGNRSRFLSETFYQDGNTRTSSDYQYEAGKKFFYKFNSDGRVTHSSSEPITGLAAA